MLNPALDTFADLPFDRLRALLGPVEPPKDVEPLVLSIGEPQHAPPPGVAEVLAANAHLWGKYPPVDASPAFRRAVADWLTRRYGLPSGWIDPDTQILPIAGSREALFLIGHLAVPRRKKGRRPVVLVPSPYYHVYSAVPQMMGAEAVYVPATAETGFLPDYAALDPAVLERTALAFLCTPSNPQGAVAGLETLKRAVALAQRHDFILAVDECYTEIYTDGPPAGALQACAEMGEGLDHVVVFHSLSKRSSVPGLRSGFVAGAPAAMALFRRLRSYAGAGVPGPVIEASIALWGEESHVEANRALYRAKFEAAERLLGPRFGAVTPAGGFFLWLDVGDGEAAACALWREAAIRVLPGAYMARPDAAGRNPGSAYIRVALVHDLATTTRALERLVKVL
jgi:N-succinyldiaminopimelate aminotransferase